MKKVNCILNLIIGSFIGAFIGRSIYRYWDYKTHPDIYLVNSAPWYTDIVFNGIVTAVIIAIALIIKFFIYKKTRK